MKNEDPYDIAEAFARLTAVFEDAAETASEGQASGLSPSSQIALTDELGILHMSAGDLLIELRGALLR